MARLVKRTLTEPVRLAVDGKEQWFCRSGLSKNQPYCDGSHKLTRSEAADKLYWYDGAGQRHEIAGPFPDIRAY